MIKTTKAMDIYSNLSENFKITEGSSENKKTIVNMTMALFLSSDFFASIFSIRRYFIFYINLLMDVDRIMNKARLATNLLF